MHPKIPMCTLDFEKHLLSAKRPCAFLEELEKYLSTRKVLFNIGVNHVLHVTQFWN